MYDYGVQRSRVAHTARTAASTHIGSDPSRRYVCAQRGQWAASVTKRGLGQVMAPRPSARRLSIGILSAKSASTDSLSALMSVILMAVFPLRLPRCHSRLDAPSEPSEPGHGILLEFGAKFAAWLGYAAEDTPQSAHDL
ncbi:hypothetical protein T310_5098 [Rasamsonia emersonii CBS 393.64]|uniref:Uncharacterized protein n=1 Tax=Rasamsonia emersonii (strain ATCC 16479 / CBS 393.64 / IMI 116815) TaxID=1408163 RepID=A0A0F4YRG5_RASE3|nr:hypothetical protein T310_5098 [Rasamsonia emersonii CBS 393.64]KKA20882.1 hypothetical protein T310_5098 [Rasamsonia emersonii CBS 393.64]